MWSVVCKQTSMLECQSQEAGSPSATGAALPPPPQPAAPAPPKGSSREPETSVLDDDYREEANGLHDPALEVAAVPQELRDARERCLKVRGAFPSEVSATIIAGNSACSCVW